MARTEIDTINAARLRSALATAGKGYQPEGVDNEINFEVKFAWETMSVGFNHGEITVARVMPSGNVTGQVEFRGMPMDMVIAAVLALASEMSL